MLELLVFTLFVLWLFGLVSVGGLTLPDIALFTLNGVNITLWDLIALMLVAWIIGLLPSPFSEIGGVMLILWILATLGILSIAGLPNMLMVAILLGLVLYLISWRTPV
jgi:hypothetical protein